MTYVQFFEIRGFWRAEKKEVHKELLEDRRNPYRIVLREARCAATSATAFMGITEHFFFPSPLRNVCYQHQRRPIYFVQRAVFRNSRFLEG